VDIIRERFIPIGILHFLGVSTYRYLMRVLNNIRSQRKETIKIDIVEDRCNDISVLNLLKTLIDNPKMIDILKNIDIKSIFGEHQSIYKAIVDKDMDNPKVMELSSDDCYIVLSPDEFKKAICKLLIIKYRNLIKEIIYKEDISNSKKCYIVRKVKTDIIPNLKKGKILDDRELLID